MSNFAQSFCRRELPLEFKASRQLTAHSPLSVPNKGPGGRNKQPKGAETVKLETRLETFFVVTDISNSCPQLVIAAPFTARGFQSFSVLVQVFE